MMTDFGFKWQSRILEILKKGILPLWFFISYLAGRYLQSKICESCVYLRKSMPPYIASAKTYQQLTGMLCNVACHHDHVPDHRA